MKSFLHMNRKYLELMGYVGVETSFFPYVI